MFEKAIESFKTHSKSIKNKKIMVIIDFSKPSNEKRLFVINPKTKKILRSHHVAHGSRSNCVYGASAGRSPKAYSCYFSNKIGSRKSCLGAMVTGKVYTWGKRYPSKLKLKLHGLEKSNSNAFVRAIVMHSSNYVTDAYIARNGRAGNSWGCPAVDPAIADSLIELIKDGVFIYCHD